MSSPKSSYSASIHTAVPTSINIDNRKHGSFDDDDDDDDASYSDEETIQNLPTLDLSRQSSISSGQSEDSNDSWCLANLWKKKPPAPISYPEFILKKQTILSNRKDNSSIYHPKRIKLSLEDHKVN